MNLVVIRNILKPSIAHIYINIIESLFKFRANTHLNMVTVMTKMAVAEYAVVVMNRVVNVVFR